MEPLHAWTLSLSVAGALLWRVLPPLGMAWLPLVLLLLILPSTRCSLAHLRLALAFVLLFLVVQGPGALRSPSPARPHPWGAALPRVKALLVQESSPPAAGLEGLAEEASLATGESAPAASRQVVGWWHDGFRWRPLPGLLDLWPHPRRAPAWPSRPWCLILPGQGDSLGLEMGTGEMGPFMPDPRRMAWQRGRLARLRLDSLQMRLQQVDLPASRPFPLTAALRRLREVCARRLLEGSGAGGPWMVAILLGEQSLLPPKEVELWQRTGLAHLLAVSGLNTGVLALALWQGLAPLPLRRGWKDTLLALLLLLYLPLAGWQVSVKRAVGMALVLLAGRSLERPQSGLGALALTASILLWLEPAELARPGFQMSCGAVAALLMGMGQQAGRAAPSAEGRWRAGLRKAWLGLWQALRLSAVAQAGTAVFQLACFGSLPLSGLALNVVAVPLSSIFTVAAFLHLLLPLPGEPLGALCEALAATITWCAAHVPVLALNWQAHPLQMALLALASVVALLPLRGLRPLPRLGLAGLVLVVAVDLLPRWQRPRAWICLFNAGQGDALLLSSPHGRGVLVDAGWDDPRGGGQRGGRLAQACARILPQPPQWLVLSHPDQDHLGGAEAWLRAMPACTILWNGEWKENPPQQRLRSALAEHGRTLVVARPGTLLQAEAEWRLRVLGPPPPAPGVEGNERSIVLRLESAQGAVMLTADAGHAEEKWLAAWGPWLHSRWLKVGHHGSRGSSSPSFLDLVRPAEAWISSGAGNRYGHPHGEVLRELRARGVRVHRTDRQGWRWLPLDGGGRPGRAMPRPRLALEWAAGRAPPGTAGGGSSRTDSTSSPPNG